MKQFLIIILPILLFFSCKGKEGYMLEGKITNLESKVVYFAFTLPDSGNVKVDSVYSDKNGKFTYEGISDKLLPVVVYFENGNVWTTVWIQNNEKLTMSGDVRYPELITTNGNEINDLLAEFKTQNKNLLQDKRDLIDRHLSSGIDRTDSLNSDTGNAEYKSKISNIEFQLREKAENFIDHHPSSVASLVLLQDYVMDVANPQSIQKYLSKISGKAIESPLYKKLELLSQRIQRTTVGSVAPDFTVMDVKNDTINLSSYRGKYFLLVFGASWCEMCQKENKEFTGLRKLVNKDKMEMLTISLDEDSTSWLNVVKQEGLNWYQVVDKHGWNSEMVSLYNITEIPSNVLIDKESIIVGKNLPIDSIQKIVEKK